MTVREIAELAGVSIGTVDRVIYKRGRVSPETKAKIEQIIERYQWTTNPLARSLKRRRPYHFCSLFPRQDQDAGYWEQVLRGIKNGESMIMQLGVQTEIIQYDRYNLQSFKDATLQVLEKPPDGLIFAPVMPDTTLPFIAEVEAEGIPYIFIDADISEMKPRCVIAQDPYKSGYLAGRLMHLFIGAQDKQLAVLDAHGEDYHIRRRRDGFISYTAEKNLSVVIQEYSGYQGTELPKTAVEQFLRENKNITGIFTTNAMVHRASEVVRSLRRESLFKGEHFCIIGYDLVPANRRLLQEGGITAIISQRPEEQGKQALLNLYRAVVLEQQIPPKIEIPIHIYIKENIPPEDQE
jgi:LacI family transcriptional regulator